MLRLRAVIDMLGFNFMPISQSKFSEYSENLLIELPTLALFAELILVCQKR